MVDSESIVVIRHDFYNLEGVETLKECVLVSQLFFWLDSMEGMPFYKTDYEICEETGLSLKEIKCIKQKISSTSWLRIEYRGLPKKTYYLFDIKALLEKLRSQHTLSCLRKMAENIQSGPQVLTSEDKRDSLVSPSGTHKSVQIVLTNIEQKHTQELTHKKETPTPFSPKSPPRLSNEFLDSKFQEFLEIANFPDYPLSKQQEARALFFGQLQSDLGEHTLDDFLDCARAYYVDDRPTDPKYIIRPHNFISKKQVGTNQRINPWKDWIGKKKPKQKTEEEKQEELLARIRKEYEARGENCYV